MDDFVHFHLRLNRSTFYFSPPPSTSKRLPLFLQVENERKRNVRPRTWRKITNCPSDKKREESKKDRCNAIDTSQCTLGHTHTHTHGIVFIDINAKRRKGGGGFGLFRGRIEKFNRRARSDALVMHRSGANLLSARCEREMDERKGHGAPSSSNYQAFIPWKTSSLPLFLSFAYCHRWPFFRSSIYGVIKKLECPRIDRLLCLPERSRGRDDASVFSDTLICPGGRVFLMIRR